MTETTGDQSIGRLVRRIDPHVWDTVLAFVLTAAAFVLVALAPAAPGWRRTDALGVVLLLAMTLPLVVLRSHPAAVFVITGVASVVGAAFGYQSIMVGYVTGAIALFTVTVKSHLLGSMLAGLAASAMLIGVYAFLWAHGTSSVLQGVVAWFVFSAVWLAGMALHAYRENVAEARERASQERERADLYLHDLEMHAMEAVTLERARVARELHDTVGHALNVVVMHAGAARRVIDKKPDQARESLSSIESAGRQALADIERMLGILRAEVPEAESMTAEAGMAQLPALIDQVREAGLPVEVLGLCEGIELPSSLDLSAYRIVQEALTNTLKHAGPAHATVRIGCDEEWLDIEVMDDGIGAASGEAATAPTRRGRGLVGMRERVVLFGGELDVGPRREGGYRVYARLPLGGM